jgi:hypothetical protein
MSKTKIIPKLIRTPSKEAPFLYLEPYPDPITYYYGLTWIPQVQLMAYLIIKLYHVKVVNGLTSQLYSQSL